IQTGMNEMFPEGTEPRDLGEAGGRTRLLIDTVGGEKAVHVHFLNDYEESGAVAHTCNSKQLRRLRQEDCKFEASLNKLMRPCLKIKNKKGWGTQLRG
uniref:COP9 signalosome complex subunit 9 n=1 Tax=Sciurus vulgaris TaxID=55149 RepID=A0A8D2APN5_SCIVU